jgi:hypothetical protein
MGLPKISPYMIGIGMLIILVIGYMYLTDYRIIEIEPPIIGGKIKFDPSSNSSEKSTITPSKEQTSSDFNVKITDPKDEQIVGESITVKGESSGDIPERQYLWLLVGLEKNQQWWPQMENIRPIEDKWEIGAAIGGEPEERLKMKLVMMLVGEKVNSEFEDWKRNGKLTGSYPPFEPIPPGKVLDSVYVIKGI